MGKLKAMPAEAIIDGFKGTIDFYFYMGVPCFRKWPKSPGRLRAPAVQAGWASFAYASREWNNLSEDVRRAYEIMAGDSGLSGRDMFARSYLSGLYRNPLP